MDFKEIRVEKQGAICWITLNRPAKLNSLTEIMMAEWRQVLTSLKDDATCRVIVVTGEGKSWSAGVDLSVFQRIKIEAGFQMYEDGIAVIDMLETMPQVTIAMVNGYCFTGALEIMLGFDMVICAEEAKIGDTHAKWGIPPKWGMTQRLPAQVGLRKAKLMSLTAQTISGKEAERIGLATIAVPLAELKETTQKIANQVIGNSAQTIAAIKKLYDFGHKNTLQEGLGFERGFEAELTDKAVNLKNFRKEI